jgi:hypothetical protein
MQMSPSWEATDCAATQEFPNILSEPKVHYRFDKRPPLVLILSKTSTVYTTLPCLFKIYFNIVTYTPVARQRVGKQVPAKTDSW